MNDKIKKLPKVELHLHLDGSISLDLASKLSGLDIEVLNEKMIAPSKCENLSQYLTKFDFSCSLMQTYENLKKVAKDLVGRLSYDNVIYAEIRFAPMFHVNDGLSYEKIVEAVLEGLSSNDKIRTNLILCMMRGMPYENNLKTIEVASKYLGKGVCALDLAGAEDKYPLDDYLDLFEIVKQKGIPFIIHAGENGSYEEVRKAVEVGAKRIGHGIHSIDDDVTLNLIKEKNVLLEVCPTSNVQTNSIDEYVNHPVLELYKLGIPICINTDNSTVSNISLVEEYLKLSKVFNFTISDYIKMNKNAIKYSFLNDEEKEFLYKRLDEYEKNN